jgi:hypothetical protein
LAVWPYWSNDTVFWPYDRIDLMTQYFGRLYWSNDTVFWPYDRIDLMSDTVFWPYARIDLMTVFWPYDRIDLMTVFWPYDRIDLMVMMKYFVPHDLPPTVWNSIYQCNIRAGVSWLAVYIFHVCVVYLNRHRKLECELTDSRCA